jgi:hypothetical protein
MKMPSFQDFSRNQSTYYAFATIIALITIFGFWRRSEEKQSITDQNNLKECMQHSKILENKIELLHEKIIVIVQKQNLKDSIK